MMKNAFYFMLKFLLVLEVLTFLSYFCTMSKNDLIRKLRLISKFMTSQTGQIIIAIRILPNILISKDNQAMKFGQLIENNVRNIIL